VYDGGISAIREVDVRFIVLSAFAFAAGQAGAAVMLPVARESRVEVTVQQQPLTSPTPTIVTESELTHSLSSWSGRTELSRASAEQSSIFLPTQLAVVLSTLALEPGTEFGVTRSRAELHLTFDLDSRITLRLDGHVYRDDDAWPQLGAYNNVYVTLTGSSLSHSLASPPNTTETVFRDFDLQAGRYQLEMVAWAEAYSYGYIPSSRAGLFATLTIIPEPSLALLALGSIGLLSGRRLNA
jgi:hypothetical protein